MDRDIWSGLALFAAVAEAGSFSSAAGRLGVTPSALSHALKGVETRLGVRLLHRTTRSVAPTPAGEALLARLRPALADVEAAVEGLNAARERPAGRVRLTTHRTAALFAVLPRLPEFSAAYPDIEVELDISDQLVDIVAERFDAGIRHEHVLDLDMVSVRLAGPMPTLVVAAPGYLAHHPAPARPEEVREHACLNYRFVSTGALYRWEFEVDGRALALDAPGRFVTNDPEVLVEAALGGMGLAYVTEGQVARHLASGALVGLLAEWCVPVPATYLYYPSRQGVSAALRAFIDAMRQAG